MVDKLFQGGTMLDRKFWQDKKVLITGHTGFKGTWLSAILVNLGAHVTGYALEADTKPSIFKLSNMEQSLESVIGDIRDFDTVYNTFTKCNPEIIFHLAAQPIVRKAYTDPVNTYDINVMGTVNIMEAMRLKLCAKSFVNVTTDKVYFNNEWPWGYRENDRLCGADPYSNSKSCSELVTFSYINSFFNDYASPAISTARAGNVIGGGDFSQDRIIPDCIRAAQKGENIIVRNPNSIRPYQHVLECLSGYLLLAQKQYENKSQYAGNYNFGPNDTDCIRTGQLADLFCKSWGNGQKWVCQNDNGPHEANFLKLDCSKAKAVLSWKPRWDVEMAMQKTVDVYKEIIKPNGVLKELILEQIDTYFS